MKTLKQLCKPRQSVFDRSRRDVVLDLTDLIEDKIKPAEFLSENYLTEGMKRLLRESFRRFSGSNQGVFVLSQAMGGGKTHNMIVLGLFAKHPELRQAVMGSLYEADNLGAVRVVAFTGRESDAPLGVWGAIAEQLGKREVFKDYYSPLSAPGQTAWVNLLKGEPLLILLDELPPYLEDAESKLIGDSNLAKVTTTAISNLIIHAYDLDFNDRDTLGEIIQINPNLDNAISHDIASGGGAIAEIMDSHLGGTDAIDAAKLLFLTSKCS